MAIVSQDELIKRILMVQITRSEWPLQDLLKLAITNLQQQGHEVQITSMSDEEMLELLMVHHLLQQVVRMRCDMHDDFSWLSDIQAILEGKKMI